MNNTKRATRQNNPDSLPICLVDPIMRITHTISDQIPVLNTRPGLSSGIRDFIRPKFYSSNFPYEPVYADRYANSVFMCELESCYKSMHIKRCYSQFLQRKRNFAFIGKITRFLHLFPFNFNISNSRRIFAKSGPFQWDLPLFYYPALPP